MEWKISNRKERITLAIVTALVAFSTVFLLTGYILTEVYGQLPPTIEQEELANDENGKKKSYTDCEGYETYTQSKGISKHDADFGTAEVDMRIKYLSDNYANDDEKDELDCLQAIRAVEEYAMVKFKQTTQDMIDGLDAAIKIEQLKEKYDIQN